jgi:sulfite exporter TauE/SafE
MLSSIHPLGERARHNRWGLTVGAFTVASTLAGAVVGAGLGWVGSLLVGSIEEASLLLGTAVLALTAGALDLARVRPPGPERQVNEAWIGHYRGWVYGGAFGVELGIGVMTFVVTWGVYATYGAQLLSASPWRGAVVGGVFGFGRSLALLVARRIDRPSILTDFHRRMADLGLPVRRGAALSLAVAGVLGTIGAIL